MCPEGAIYAGRLKYGKMTITIGVIILMAITTAIILS